MNVIERIRAREQRKLNRIKAAKQATPEKKPKKTTATKTKAVVVEPPTPPVAEEVELPEEPVG